MNVKPSLYPEMLGVRVSKEARQKLRAVAKAAKVEESALVREWLDTLLGVPKEKLREIHAEYQKWTLALTTAEKLCQEAEAEYEAKKRRYIQAKAASVALAAIGPAVSIGTS